MERKPIRKNQRKNKKIILIGARPTRPAFQQTHGRRDPAMGLSGRPWVCRRFQLAARFSTISADDFNLLQTISDNFNRFQTIFRHGSETCYSISDDFSDDFRLWV
jgi:hypothetical protein